MMKNKKRYLLIVLMVLVILLGNGCGKEEEEGPKMSIEEIVAKHYEQDFNYTKVITVQDGPDGISFEVALTGEYQHDPYKEYLTIDFKHSDIDYSPWTEERFSGDEELVFKETVTNNGVREEYVQRPYYPGYITDVSYAFVEETRLNGDKVDLYNAEYIVDVAEEYGIANNEITAVIKQEYYIDPIENQIVKIVTYYEDYHDKINLINHSDGSGAYYSQETYTFYDFR